MLSKPNRLARRRDFAAVYARKKSWANPLLVLNLRFYAKNSPGAEWRRFGFSVSKKVGKAHDRNKVKRRLREVCRLAISENATDSWKPGFDAVFIARTESAKSSYKELETAVRDLSRRAGLLVTGAARATNAAPDVPKSVAGET